MRFATSFVPPRLLGQGAADRFFAAHSRCALVYSGKNSEAPLSKSSRDEGKYLAQLGSWRLVTSRTTITSATRRCGRRRSKAGDWCGPEPGLDASRAQTLRRNKLVGTLEPVPESPESYLDLFSK